MIASPANGSSARRRASVAVDLGAESCRVSLVRWLDGTPHLQLVHRFPNGPVLAADGTLRWPLQAIVAGVEHGLRLCGDLAPEGIASIGVDGWAVDYVRLAPDGTVTADPFCYRDERNLRAAAALHQTISPQRLREITGVEQQPINTLYQLYADKLAGLPDTPWLNLPESMLHRWGARPVAEHTNASHTQLLDLETANWSEEVFRAAQLDLASAPRIVSPGTALGKLSGPLAAHPALHDTELIAPACHDTASAIAGIAHGSNDWAYISCGTWSLVGTLLDTPLNTVAVQQDNFTNLAAVGGQTCFHKGINGLWILKQCLDTWAAQGVAWDLADLLRAAEQMPAPRDLLDVDDPALMSPGDMPKRINAQRLSRGVPPLPEDGRSAPVLVSLLLHSLAARYAEVLARLRFHTGKDLRRIVMVGGGAQNAMLRRLTAQRTRLEVVTGPAESSTIGNLAVQCAVLYGNAAASSPDFLPEVRAWAGQIGSLATPA